MIIRIAALLLLLGAEIASAQTLRGTVLDADTGAPLGAANILLLAPDPDPETGRVLVTGGAADTNGRFVLRGMAPGSYLLEVRFVGYETYVEPVDLAEGADVRRDVRLVPAAQDLRSVFVLGERIGGVSAVAAGLEIIRPADIDRIPVPGVSGDLAAYVQSVPGVTVQGDRGGQFFIRGGGPDQNEVLLDGVPIYAPFHVLSAFSAFPGEIVEDASLYTAGFGADHGGRLSSVLSVKAAGGNPFRPQAAVAASPFVSGVRIEGPIRPGRVSGIVTARRSLLEELTPNLVGERMRYRFGDLFGKVQTGQSGSNRISAFGLYTTDFGDLSGTPETFLGDAIALAESDSTLISWSNAAAGVRYARLRSDRLESPRLVWTAGWSRTESDFGPEASKERTSSIASLDSRLAYNGRWWRAGVQYRLSDLAYRVAGQFEEVPANGDERVSEYAAFVMTTLTAGRVALEPGLRLQHVGQAGVTVIDPRLRLHWSLSDDHSLHAAAGRYHQAIVGVSDTRDVANVFTIWRSTGDDLPSSLHLVAGWTGRFGGGWRVAAEAFHKRYDDLQITRFSAFPRFTTGLEAVDGTATGMDVRISSAGIPFVLESTASGWVTYSLGRVQYEGALGTFPAGHDRRHYVQGVAEATRGEVTIMLQAQIGSGLPFTPSAGFDTWLLMNPDVDVRTAAGVDRVLYADRNSGRQPTYARFDLWVERRMESDRVAATLRAGAMNIFNRDNLFYYDLFTFRRVNQLPVVPSVGLKLEVL